MTGGAVARGNHRGNDGAEVVLPRWIVGMGGVTIGTADVVEGMTASLPRGRDARRDRNMTGETAIAGIDLRHGPRVFGAEVPR